MLIQSISGRASMSPPQVIVACWPTVLFIVVVLVMSQVYALTTLVGELLPNVGNGGVATSAKNLVPKVCVMS